MSDIQITLEEIADLREAIDACQEVPHVEQLIGAYVNSALTEASLAGQPLGRHGAQ